jgi:hypothetical protein
MTATKPKYAVVNVEGRERSTRNKHEVRIGNGRGQTIGHIEQYSFDPLGMWHAYATDGTKVGGHGGGDDGGFKRAAEAVVEHYQKHQNKA